jgi:tRNA-2-methylthio-N6-dimethylallyladenosine synthase
VPYTRGKEYSRPQAELLAEAKQLVAAGSLDITLLGQNVSAYFNEGGLAALLKKLAAVDGVERLRYITSHPRDMTDAALFDLHANEPKLMPYLHLPVQSGSDKILKAMNRKHTRDEYFKIIDKFAAAREDMAFSSDFIVGYPGETDADHADTLDLVRRVPFGLCYSFKYSPRPGTPAAALTSQVPEEVKAQRLQELQELLQEKQMQFNKSCEGREFEVLFEKKGKFDGQVMGKSPYLQAVVVQGDAALLGQIKKVRVKRAMFSNLQAELV